MPYFNIEIKQILSDKTDKFELVYDPGTDKEFITDIEYFALCNLYKKACQGEDEAGLENYMGVILPVVFCEDEGLVPELLSDYKLPNEQEVRLRKKG